MLHAGQDCNQDARWECSGAYILKQYPGNPQAILLGLLEQPEDMVDLAGEL